MMKKLSSSYIVLIIVLGSITITTVLADTVTIGTYPYIIQDGSSNQRLVITSSGNVGIGTSTPAELLDLGGSSPVIRFEGTHPYAIAANTGAFRVYDYNAGLDRFYISSTGNVGIGTSTPAANLDVAGNVRLTGNIVSPNDICIGSC